MLRATREISIHDPQAFSTTQSHTALVTLAQQIARLLKGTFVRDVSDISPAYEPVVGVLQHIDSLVGNGVFERYTQVHGQTDEPRMIQWSAQYDGGKRAGGLSVNNHREALMAMLGEMQERFVWGSATDHLRLWHGAQSASKKKTIHITDIAGHDNATHTHSSFGWARAFDWVSRTPIWVPAQLVSAQYARDVFKTSAEPRLREVITTGLATGPDKYSALLGGTLELVERDAFMVMWLNQLTLPRVAHDDVLLLADTALQSLLASCRRYHLDVSIVRLVTDAPTYAMLVVIEDTRSGVTCTVGASAHQNPAHATRKALLEALRARVRFAELLKRGVSAQPSLKEKRVCEWFLPERQEGLRFLSAGSYHALVREAWLGDTTREHFLRITQWCKEKGYVCASVKLTKSKRNFLKWPIYMMVIPQMQPLEYSGNTIPTHGARLWEVPKQCGYTPRTKPFTDFLHPFY